MLDRIIAFAPVIIIVALVVGIVASGYKKAPPDTAFIVSGLRRRGVLLHQFGELLPVADHLLQLHFAHDLTHIAFQHLLGHRADVVGLLVHAVAKAEADRQANEARVNADREIAIKKNELDIQMAELKKREDTKLAMAAFFLIWLMLSIPRSSMTPFSSEKFWTLKLTISSRRSGRWN